MPAGWNLVANGQVAVANFELDEAPPCAEVAPVAPTVKQASCDGGMFRPPTVVLPANTTVISYTQIGQAAVGRSVIVTAELGRETDTWATALPAGWALEGSFAVFPAGPFAKAVCTPAEPLIVPAACHSGVLVPASVKAPADTNVMLYRIESDADVTLVTVETRTGSVLVNPLPTGWISGATVSPSTKCHNLTPLRAHPRTWPRRRCSTR
ncbi:MAG: hypothetical protein M3457_20745 [Chloroflexota bacterium]|nr:hypothetical protein [Chloroflexota bacterium]